MREMSIALRKLLAPGRGSTDAASFDGQRNQVAGIRGKQKGVDRNADYREGIYCQSDDIKD